MATSEETTNRLRKLAKNRKFEELTTELLEAVTESPLEVDDLVSVLRVAGHRADDPETILWMALSAWGEARGAASGIEAARGLADLAPVSELLREEIAGLYRAAFPDLPALETGLARTVADPAVPLPDGIRWMDGVVRVPPGTYVMEPGRKDPGRVLGLAGDGSGLEVEFGAGPRTLPLDRAAELQVLDPDDFRPLAVFERERLTALAAEDPRALLEMLLRAHSPLPYRGIRSHLVDIVPGAWTEWWAEARPKIRRSPWIDVGPGTQPVLELRRVPLAEDVRVRREVADAEGEERLRVVLDYLEDAGDHAAQEADLLAGLADVLSPGTAGDDPLAFATRAVLRELRGVASADVGGVDPAEGGLPDRSPSSLVGDLEDPRLQLLSLALAREVAGEEWPDFFAAAMPLCHPDVIAAAATELSAAGEDDRLVLVSQAVMAHPVRFPGALIWLWRTVGNGGLPEVAGGPNRELLLTHLLAALDRESRGEGAKSAAFNRLRNALVSKGCGVVRTVLESLDLEAGRRIRDAMGRCLGMPDVVRQKLTDLLVDTHTALFVKDLPPWADETVIYTTRAGLARKQAEYETLVTERLPEIARQIGEAAALGDLSENAEYTAALETRARLTERANALKADLDRAREIPPEMPEGDEVTVGSRIVAKNLETRDDASFTFLGPWDANMEKGIYSYRAPVSRAFMGKRKGHVAAVKRDRDEERWEILEVRSGLEG